MGHLVGTRERAALTAVSRLMALVLVGIVLFPLRAAAATVPALFAYDAAIRSLGTVRVEAGPSLRPELGGVREYVYDDAHDGYDDASNPLVVSGAGTVHAYDGALQFTARGELGEGPTYDGPAAPTAAGGADMALRLATRPPGGGPTLLNQFAERIGAKTYGQLTGSWWPGSYEALETNVLREMNGARSLHFNLEGMDMGKFAEFAKNPMMGPGNATNWELFTILKNPSLLGKTNFHGGVPPAL